MLGAEAAGDFGPEDTVGGNAVAGFGSEIEAREDAGRQGDGCKDYRKYPRLECVLHGEVLAEGGGLHVEVQSASPLNAGCYAYPWGMLQIIIVRCVY